MKDSALIVFVKNIELGKVKTRIGAVTGPEKALEIYVWLTNHLRKVVSEWHGKRLLFYSRFINNEDEWSSVNYSKHLQHSGNIGIRMAKAFEFALSKHRNAVLIGSDCPDVSVDIIENAFQALKKSDVVFGPAIDGGYYLVGMSNFYPELFENIEWSTAKVLNQTLAKVQKLGLSYELLPTLSDIDTIQDWEAFLKNKS